MNIADIVAWLRPFAELHIDPRRSYETKILGGHARDILAMLDQDDLPWKVMGAFNQPLAAFRHKREAESWARPIPNETIIVGPDDAQIEYDTNVPAEDIAALMSAFKGISRDEHGGVTAHFDDDVCVIVTGQDKPKTPTITFKPYEPEPDDQNMSRQTVKALRDAAIRYANNPTAARDDALFDAAVDYTLASSPPIPKTLADLPDLCLAEGTDGKLYSKRGRKAWIRSAENLLEYHQAPTNPAEIPIARVLGYPQLNT